MSTRKWKYIFVASCAYYLPVCTYVKCKWNILIRNCKASSQEWQIKILAKRHKSSLQVNKSETWTVTWLWWENAKNKIHYNDVTPVLIRLGKMVSIINNISINIVQALAHTYIRTCTIMHQYYKPSSVFRNSKVMFYFYSKIQNIIKLILQICESNEEALVWLPCLKCMITFWLYYLKVHSHMYIFLYANHIKIYWKKCSDTLLFQFSSCKSTTNLNAPLSKSSK